MRASGKVRVVTSLNLVASAPAKPPELIFIQCPNAPRISGPSMFRRIVATANIVQGESLRCGDCV